MSSSNADSEQDVINDTTKPVSEEKEREMGSVKSKLKKITDTKSTRNSKSEEMEIAGDEHAFMCGVVEGFYGRPWTAEQRKELFRRMEEMGLNTYLYAPKDDYKHRMFWREKYSLDEAELLKTLIEEADSHDVVFVYAISPGLDIAFSSQKDITALKEKLLQVQELGCKAFALLFDDIDPVLSTADMEEFQSSADAQASLTNMMYDALDNPRFIFCPTEYCSTMAIPDVASSPYLQTLGTTLNPHISVMWTGAKVVSNIITVDSIKQLNRILRRKVLIWDNIHANDYDPKRVFLGPFKGRSTQLIPHVSGVLTNPNCEFETNFVAMHTIATWWKSYKVESVSIKDKAAEVPETQADEEMKGGESVMESNSQPLTHDVESISSGRASDSDSDTDSDYSSHEGNYFLSMSDAEHGDYNPTAAFEKALQDWLPIFSWVRYPTRKVVPRSGTPTVLLKLPSASVATSSPMSNVCVTMTVKEPVLSVGQTGEWSSKPQNSDTAGTVDHPGTSQSPVAKTPSDNVNDDIEISSEDSECTTQVESGLEGTGKETPYDVDMANVHKEPVKPYNNSEFIPGQSPDGDAKDNSITEKKDDNDSETVDNKNTTTIDVEMNEYHLQVATDEKTIEEMQTSPKTNTDKMETEELQEPSTPMMTDDVDSDVSMATAPSGSAVPTDVEDVMQPSPAGNASEIKASQAEEKFVKLQPEKTGGLSLNDTMATPKATDTKEAIVDKYECDPLTVDDLRLLAECFFLPYEHGPLGTRMVQKFRWLRENAVKLSRISDKKSEEYLYKALDWSEKALAFEEHCRDIQRIFNKICSCPNRALLYDIFPYIWDIKGIITMLRSYVKWLGRVEVKPDSQQEKDGDSHDGGAKKMLKTSFGWLGPDPEPWVFRGGLSGEFQRLLPVSTAFDLFCQTVPLDPQTSAYVVRPYVAADEQSVFAVCYATDNDGMESSDAFLHYRQLPADRLVGALLTLSPEYCFVVEDEEGLCGYLAAACDAKKFWKKYELAYLPEMREKYEKPAETDSELTEVEKMIVDLHSTEDRFDYGNDELPNTHPSFLTMALHPRANSNIAKSMLVCLLSALKSHHSCGVHTITPSDSLYFFDLYTKLGFTNIRVKDDDIGSDKNIKILGRTF